ncbi:MAG: calcium/sodium antiporter [Pirellulales bacterium]
MSELMWTLAGILGGFTALAIGGELLVGGTIGLARAWRVTPLVIGLTVVSFATSTPELAVSLQSAVAEQTELALGNALGSNIFNVLFILGGSALLVPLSVSSRLIRFDVPWMIGVAALVWLLAADGHLGRIDGLVLVALLVAYVAWTVVQSRYERPMIQQGFAQQLHSTARSYWSWIGNAVAVVAGLLLLTVGARWLVAGAAAVAVRLGVSDLIIGLTIVAVGTSLPEVAAALVAGLRGQRDIAVGNVIGSNIFNMLVVLGIPALATPYGIDVPRSALILDFPILMAVSLVCLPIFFTGNLVARWEGGLLLAYYLAYTLYLVLAAQQHDAGTTWGTILLLFIVPLTLLGVVLSLGLTTKWMKLRRLKNVVGKSDNVRA